MTLFHNRALLVFGIIVLALTACGEVGATDRPGSSAEGQASSGAGHAHDSAGHGDVGTEVAVGEYSATQSTGTETTDVPELRITLEQLLGQHATLAVRFMRGRVDGVEEFTRVAVDALVTNTEQLTEAVASVHGAEAGAAFEQLWSGHVTSFFDYAVGVAENDDEAMRAAEADLDTYAEEFASLVESATDQQLAAADVAEGLDLHVDHLLRQIDAYAAGDYATAFDLQHEAYAHMFPTGQLLAEGMSSQHPGELPLPVDQAPQQLRSALGMMLGEHVELAIEAMRAGVAGAPYFEQAAAALNRNTTDLTEAIDALFGSDAAARFNTMWANHVDAFVQYTAALADGDEDAKQAALHQLHEFHEALGQHLSDMTGGELSADAAAEVLRIHDEQLIEQVEAYAAEDYEAAYQVSFDAYQHVFGAAAALSGAIEAHLGPQLPVGGAQTGGGAMAKDRDGQRSSRDRES